MCPVSFGIGSFMRPIVQPLVTGGLTADMNSRVHY